MVRTLTTDLLRKYPSKFIDDANDVRWVFNTHLRGIDRPAWVKSLVLYGNDYAPIAVELFDKVEVTIHTYPTFTIFFQ